MKSKFQSNDSLFDPNKAPSRTIRPGLTNQTIKFPWFVRLQARLGAAKRPQITFSKCMFQIISSCLKYQANTRKMVMW